MGKQMRGFEAWIAIALLALLSSGVGAQVSTNTPATQTAQIEKGRQVVAQVCATCHATLGRMIQVHKQTAEEWRSTVYFMISRGAQIMPDEIEAVTAFLAATAGQGSQATIQAPGRGRGAGPAGQPSASAGGAAILQRNCQQCHELATATKKPAGQEWNAIVSRMMSYGARLAPADRDTLIGYLNELK